MEKCSFSPFGTFPAVRSLFPDSAQDFSPPPTSSTNMAYDPNPSSAQGKVVASGAHDYKPVDDLFGGAPLDGADDPFSGVKPEM